MACKGEEGKEETKGMGIVGEGEKGRVMVAACRVNINMIEDVAEATRPEGREGEKEGRRNSEWKSY